MRNLMGMENILYVSYDDCFKESYSSSKTMKYSRRGGPASAL